MAISVNRQVESISEEDFKRIAYEVTGYAFELYNQYGRLFDEEIFQHKLAERVKSNGYQVDRELPIDVKYKDFSKKYYIDLFVDGSVLFELKRVSGLTESHRAQTLNYLFLLGLKRAKLLNFGSDEVNQEFVSTSLTPETRNDVAIYDRKFLCRNDRDEDFHEIVRSLLSEWGSFLEISLYEEAITYFLGGEENVKGQVSLQSTEGRHLQQSVNLLDPSTSFSITGFDRDQLSERRKHLRKFLKNISLEAIQWVNMAGKDVFLKRFNNIGGMKMESMKIKTSNNLNI